MIERIQQTVAMTGAVPATPFPAWNLPRASQLEIAFRVIPTDTTSQTDQMLAGLQLTFGLGNPPDFGLGNTQIENVVIAPQVVGLRPYEESLTAISEKITAVGNQIFWLGLAIAKMEVESIEERTARGQLTAAEDEKKQLEAEKRKLESEKPLGWSPYITASFTRSFDALKLSVIPGIGVGFGSQSGHAKYTLEYTIEASRPEDTGPTYTQPFQGGR